MGPDLLYLHLRLFLHLHLWPCFQPLIGLPVWPGSSVDALAAGRLARLGCWISSFIQPLLHHRRPLKRMFSQGAFRLAPASCLAYVTIVLSRVPPTHPLSRPKKPNPFLICSRPILIFVLGFWSNELFVRKCQFGAASSLIEDLFPAGVLRQNPCLTS